MSTQYPLSLRKALCCYTRFFSMINEHQVTELIPEYKNLTIVLFKNHGSRFSTQILKDLYNECLMYSLYVKFDPLTDIWLKRDKDNFPYNLKSFKAYLRSSDILKRRQALTILRAFESIELEPIQDLSSVIEPSKGKQYYSEFRDDFLNFLNKSKFFSNSRLKFSKILKKIRQTRKFPHYTFKKGIEGYSLLTAGKQSLSINKAIGESLLKIASTFNVGYFPKLLGYSRKFYKTNNDLQNTTAKTLKYTGRITFVSAPGGKSRLIAIGNYFIQDILKYIHKTIFIVLRNIPQDGTYDQKKQSLIIKELTSRKVPIWSYDLTKATDRFPVEPQIDVLKLLNRIIGSEWETILSELKFEFKGNEYKYAVGQPMGLYSSWAVFAFTHHCLIQFCAFKEGYKKPFRKYSILGDDVAIWDRDVAERYKSIISGLGIEISIQKSFYPSKSSDSKLCIAEFAKRIFLDGQEYTPIPPEIIRESMESHYEIPSLIEFLTERDFIRNDIPVSRLCYSDKRMTELCCMFRIKQILGAHLRVYLDKCKSWTQNFNERDLIKIRILALSEQAGRVYDDLDRLRYDLESELENLIDSDSIQDLPISRVFDGLFYQITEMEQKLYSFISYEYLFSDIDKDQILRDLDEIEYLPILDYQTILSARNSRPRKMRTYKGRYILKLSQMLIEKSRN